MRKWLFLILMLSVFACKGRNAEEKIIPRKDFVDLLIDLHIADAIALNHTVNENFGRLDSALLYYTILESHDCTKEQMIHSMNYYSADSEALVGIYDEVFSTLSKRSDGAKELYSSTSISRTQRIWKSEKSRYRIFGDSLQYLPPFEISIDTTGRFVISAEIKMTEADSSIMPRITAYFYDPENDTPKTRKYFKEESILKANFTREYRLIKEMKNPRLSQLKIIIPQQENTDSIFTKGIEIRNLRVSILTPRRKK